MPIDTGSLRRRSLCINAPSAQAERLRGQLLPPVAWPTFGSMTGNTVVELKSVNLEQYRGKCREAVRLNAGS